MLSEASCECYTKFIHSRTTVRNSEDMRKILMNRICKVFNLSHLCIDYIDAWRYQKALCDELHYIYKNGA